MGAWLLRTELHLLWTQLMLVGAELKEDWSVGINWFCSQSLDNPWLWVVPDVGSPVGKEEGGESLLLVPGKGGDCAEKEGEGGSTKSRSQQAGEEGILIWNMRHLPPWISQR